MEFDINSISNKYNIELEELKVLKDNVALLVKADGEKLILKGKRPQSKKSWIDNLRFFNESRVYKYFASRKFKCLHAPKLIHIDSESFLIEYLERCQDVRLANVDKDEFIKAYIELQTLNLESNKWFDLRYQLYRGVLYQGIMVPLFTLRNKIGFKQALQAVSLFLQLHLSAKKLSRKYWLHGDLTSNNIFYNKKDDKLYFIDFENMFYTRKWLLLEVIEHSFEMDESFLEFDGTQLITYLNKAASLGKDLKTINIKSQVRLAMLLTITSNLAFTKIADKRKILLSSLPVVLDNQKFESWYAENVNPLLEKEIQPAFSI